MNKEPDDITSVIILDRSMNREEFKTMYPPISPCGKNSGIIWGTGKRGTFSSNHAAGVLSDHINGTEGSRRNASRSAVVADSLKMFKILKYKILFFLIPW